MCVIADTQAVIDARNAAQGKLVRSFFSELGWLAVAFFAALFVGLLTANAWPLVIGFGVFAWRMIVHYNRMNRK